jgi:hypothetical protein
MSVYASLDKTARALIDKFGRDVLLVSGERRAFVDPWSPQYDETPDSVRAVDVGFSAVEAAQWQVAEHDRGYLFDSRVEVTTGMRIIDDGINYEIANFRRVKPGPQTMIWKVQARK